MVQRRSYPLDSLLALMFDCLSLMARRLDFFAWLRVFDSPLVGVEFYECNAPIIAKYLMWEAGIEFPRSAGVEHESSFEKRDGYPRLLAAATLSVAAIFL